MYKKYVPEERAYFRKTMRAGPYFDRFGPLPITGEDLRFYRSCPRNDKNQKAA